MTGLIDAAHALSLSGLSKGRKKRKEGETKDENRTRAWLFKPWRKIFVGGKSYLATFDLDFSVLVTPVSYHVATNSWLPRESTLSGR